MVAVKGSSKPSPPLCNGLLHGWRERPDPLPGDLHIALRDLDAEKAAIKTCVRDGRIAFCGTVSAPTDGSRTRSPGSVERLMHRAGRDVGNWAARDEPLKLVVVAVPRGEAFFGQFSGVRRWPVGFAVPCRSGR